MDILFVCSGNTFRSRLAEAYMKSLHIPGVKVHSAGIQASRNLNLAITTYAQILIDNHHISAYGKPSWTQLTQASLDKTDIVVCMNRLVYEAGLKDGFKWPLRTFVWDFPDIYQQLPDFKDKENEILPLASKTFEKIIEKVQEFTIFVRRPRSKELVDIYAEDGTPTGHKTDVDSIHSRGLWHQGVHAAIYTKDGQLLFERRAQSIIGNPGVWDFTMGGIVVAGEQPADALIREIKEELGLVVNPTQTEEIYTFKYNHYLPHYGLHSRVFVHTYLVEIEKKHRLLLQESEVGDAKYLSLPQAESFIESGYSEFGKTTSLHEFNEKLLTAVKKRF